MLVKVRIGALEILLELLQWVPFLSTQVFSYLLNVTMKIFGLKYPTKLFK